MRLGKKIGLGFGAVLAITAGVGGLAIINMLSVKQKADVIANEYAEAVAVEFEIGKYFRDAVESIQDYSLSENVRSYEKGQESLVVAADQLKAAQAKRLQELVGKFKLDEGSDDETIAMPQRDGEMSAEFVRSRASRYENKWDSKTPPRPALTTEGKVTSSGALYRE
jgi:hypothetical protein